MQEAVETRGLSKAFGKITALGDINLNIMAGELYGIVGPDGAGKTTLFQILAGVMGEAKGNASIFGELPKKARVNIGYLTQHFSLYSELSVDENLKYRADLRNVPPGIFQERRRRYLEEMNLFQFRDRLAGHLSGGMKQKLALCCALISQPKLLLLDEPTTGLDPVARREFWHLLAAIADAGTTIVVATPQFDEAELCNRVSLMHKGRIYNSGSPAQLRESLALSRIEIHTDCLHQAQQQLLLASRSAATNLVDVHSYGDRLDILTDNHEQAESQIHSFLNLASPYVVLHQQPTLENVFLSNLEERGFHQTSAPSFPAERTSLSRPGSHAAIEAANLTKRFGDFSAVKSINFHVDYGEIYGLLGANGAGKTTTIQMLSGLIDPTEGSVSVAGGNSGLKRSKSRRRVGYMSQKFTLYGDLTVKENLDYYCAAYDIPAAVRRAKMDWVILMCSLAGMENTLVDRLPRGLKQRIAFGAAVMHEPEILFLDEPTAGVDPSARRQLWNVIRDFARRGTAVLVTTHFLEDAEYCNRLGLMVSGELVAQGTPGQIKKQAGQMLEVTTDEIQRALDVLSDHFEPSLISVYPGRLRIQVGDDSPSAATIISILENYKIRAAHHPRPVPSSLEDAFVAIVRRSRRSPD